MPRDAASPGACPLRRAASSINAASSNVAPSISAITLASSSSPADTVADDRPSTAASARFISHDNMTTLTMASGASGQAEPPVSAFATPPKNASASTTATGRMVRGTAGGASAHAMSFAGMSRRGPAAAFTVAMRSRRSICDRSAETRAWRWRISSGEAARDNQAASRSSPIGVRAPEIKSNRLPTPNTSRSSA